MSKTGTLQERPKPPSFEHMKQDVENASENDVVFLAGNNALSQSNIAMIESFMELSPLDQKASNEKMSGGADRTGVTEGVEKSYQDTLELLRLNKMLARAPQELEDKYNSLQQLGEDITASISKLQKSTEAIKQ
ncbi:uncharacterized protein LOC110449463 isoform X2 [Mizuhopecten yessoensis]|uniref:Uncharacterized protein n=1 Tax=Mizuhopecten yessoensis TaxID=6573 RepID=A0A210QR47_MIZYE|nr:uncharacterized protein LOC110449463 isoform X1 [Mizuhopecten yessoensis]XP_021352015.1 uncharacterized protein LOC110449463 isoform X2 [Mizuhopecten yessoensis]OWF51220.1 hypothetical protein KP79_PYT03571 [Mizuhopecten yessoensis]